MALSSENRVCIWRDEHAADAEQELVNRLVKNGVSCLMSVEPFTPLPVGAATRAWWTESVARWRPHDVGVRTPVLVRLTNAQVHQHDVQLLLSRSPRRSLTIVLVDRDCPDPFDERKYLRESFGQSHPIEQVLRSL